MHIRVATFMLIFLFIRIVMFIVLSVTVRVRVRVRKNRAALVSFYQRHNSEKLSEKEEDGTPAIDTILSKASTHTKATAEAYKQKYDAAPELAEPTGDMVTLTVEQARAVWACVAQ